MLSVIDISTHQKNVNYQKVKDSGVQGVILRIGYTGYGVSKSKNKDAEFERHYKGFTQVGLPIGIYWYSCAYTEEEAIVEAKKTLEFLANRPIELGVWLDTEDTHDTTKFGLAKINQRMLSKEKLTSIARAYCNYIRDKCYKEVGIYASTSWLNNELDMSKLQDYMVWVAHYGVSKPTYKGKYDMWQYTSSGKVNGISGNVDMNKLYTDLIDNELKVGDSVKIDKVYTITETNKTQSFIGELNAWIDNKYLIKS